MTQVRSGDVVRIHFTDWLASGAVFATAEDRERSRLRPVIALISIEKKSLPTKEEEKQTKQRKEQVSQQRSAEIGQQVIRGLGQSSDLCQVQIRQLWQDHYRVNVLVGLSAASARVAHSYFLVTHDDGNIIAATP